MGLSLRAAFEACIGEGIEYLSQLESGDAPLVETRAKDIVQAAQGQARICLESLLAKTGTVASAQLDCLVATALTGEGNPPAAGRHLPAPRTGADAYDAAVPAQHRVRRGSHQGRRPTARPLRVGGA
jgi:hypothetical protein